MPSSILHPLSSLLLAALFWSLALRINAAPAVLQGELSIHDPSTILKCEGEYWVFGTGRGVISRHSKDLVTWEAGPRVFTNTPAWTTNAIPGSRGYFWAPDIVRCNGQYFLYYSVSTWGSQTSAIALATRSRSVTGPYLDQAGVDLLKGGGSLLMETKGRFIGPGHAGLLLDGPTQWLSFHYYNGDNQGIPALGLQRVEWHHQNWLGLK